MFPRTFQCHTTPHTTPLQRKKVCSFNQTFRLRFRWNFTLEEPETLPLLHTKVHAPRCKTVSYVTPLSHTTYHPNECIARGCCCCRCCYTLKHLAKLTPTVSHCTHGHTAQSFTSRAPWLLQSTHKVCSLMFQLRWKFTLGSIEHTIVKFSAVFGARLGECICRGRGMWGNVRVSTLSEMWCDMRPLPPHTYNPVHAPTQNRHTCLSSLKL